MEKKNLSNKFLFTSEQVSGGHPDKMCDFISDSVLDAYLELDKNAKVACETLVKNHHVILAGEITSSVTIDYVKVVKEALANIGYNKDNGYDPEDLKIVVLINEQSKEIAQSVHVEKSEEDIGAGDQGIMIGYATNESEERLPLTMVYATKLALALNEAKNSGEIPWLLPDAKTQVTLEYEKDEKGSIKPIRAQTILISTQHKEGISQKEIYETLKAKIIDKVIPKEMMDEETKFFINPSGSFVIGGPLSDAGVTGRKIIADTYGGWGGHGGGAFSGKDPTKVDRSGAYAARWIAKSLVENGYCERVIVQVTYGIGISHPISIFIDSHGTVKEGFTDRDLEGLVAENFDLRPGILIRDLKLRNPIYRNICLYNHFMPSKYALWEVPKKF
jgi:S-adenosylmethionine synthetase